ncbi:hypothetical protein EI555_019968 [Monodon monoceros]|uniref:C2H2-type domain-containing protein n=1 Tax=Monodon monoceros TaxID=40151 RepID=A0A4V5PAJ9_MONMO|nr:hypothetical protein EI555_019968 [Monodon monoceros]
MLENYRNLASLRHQLSKPPLITQMEQEDEMETVERRIHQDTCSDELILLKAKQPQQKQGILEKYTLNGKKEQTLGGNPIQCSEIVEALSVKSSITHSKIYPSKKLHRYLDSAKVLRDSSHLKPPEGILPREKSYECKKDENAFLRSSNLAGLKRQHTEETSYECSDWGKVLNSISHLKKDEKTHIREKPFECNQCGKVLQSHSSIKLHMRTYTGEKPFKCDQCGKAYSSSSCLTHHKRIHTGEKHYECHDCGKTFRDSSLLRQHSGTHSREKAYKCNQCSKTFSRSCRLTITR